MAKASRMLRFSVIGLVLLFVLICCCLVVPCSLGKGRAGGHRRRMPSPAPAAGGDLGLALRGSGGRRPRGRRGRCAGLDAGRGVLRAQQRDGRLEVLERVESAVIAIRATLAAEIAPVHWRGTGA